MIRLPFKKDPTAPPQRPLTQANWHKTKNPFGVLVAGKYSPDPIGSNVQSEHYTDAEGRPSGGVAVSTGMCVIFQDGPTLGEKPLCDAGVQISAHHYCKNGAFVEDLLEAAKSRLEHYQASAFACDENAAALEKVQEALAALAERRNKRLAEGKYGTHKV